MRGKRFVLVAVAAVVLVAQPGPASAATNKTRYVATNFYSVATAIASKATGVAVQGDVSFVPVRDRITLTIDDAVARRTVRVVIVQQGRSVRSLCVRDNVASTVAGLTPGLLSTLWIIDATERGSCHAGGTTGTVLLRN